MEAKNLDEAKKARAERAKKANPGKDFDPTETAPGGSAEDPTPTGG